ncbi:uncharacterized protein LOC133930188, partial [Phragmites australis]|uniref:uncharacterized protein LOC133930188 n=1 Tax=Phragmites australis TaxID=29695 RepID=UPI002D78E18E
YFPCLPHQIPYQQAYPPSRTFVSGETFLPKLPTPPRPWHPCLLEIHPPRQSSLPLRRRRHRLAPSAAAASSGSHSKDYPLPPAKPSSSKKAPGEIGRWKAVPPGMRESAIPDPEEPPPPPPLWSARRRARAAWRKVASWVPRKARSVVLLNLLTLIFASNISVVKEAEILLDPDLFNMLRFTISAIPFAPLLLKSLRDMQIFVGGLELGVWVIIAPFLDGLLGAEVPAYTWFRAFLSLVGIAMLELSSSPPCVGGLLNLLSAFSFAIHMLRTEHISRNMKKENFLTLVGCEVFVVAFISTASFIFKCFTRNVQHWNLKAWPPTELFGIVASVPWLAILYTGIFSTPFKAWPPTELFGMVASVPWLAILYTGVCYA